MKSDTAAVTTADDASGVDTRTFSTTENRDSLTTTTSASSDESKSHAVHGGVVDITDAGFRSDSNSSTGDTQLTTIVTSTSTGPVITTADTYGTTAYVSSSRSEDSSSTEHGVDLYAGDASRLLAGALLFLPLLFA